MLKFFIYLVAGIVSVSCVPISTQQAGVGQVFSPPASSEVEVIRSKTLKLASLNLAHGRRDSFSQVFLSEETIRDNLIDISTFLEGTGAHIIALQEADGPSAWSGNFDHVAFVAKQSGFKHHTRSDHVNSWWGDYGTGVLSRYPFQETYAHTFKPSPPTTRKGFTLVTLPWQTNRLMPPIKLDIVSLHLDFARESIRRKQIYELVHVLASRNNPVVIMGDFNSEAIAKTFLPKALASKTLVKTFPEADKRFNSYGDKKLDWVIVSEELEFLTYHVENVELSDHRPVIVEITLTEQQPLGRNQL